MSVNPKSNIEKLERILNAWTSIAPDAQFGAMSHKQFEDFINTSKTARATVADLENQLQDAIISRDKSDEIALAKAQLVKNGVLADPEEGGNSSLYAAMGYIRTDEKKSGLVRRKKLTVQPG